jgi:hypothetical protein
MSIPVSPRDVPADHAALFFMSWRPTSTTRPTPPARAGGAHGNRSIPDQVSLADPHARPVHKGKLRSLTRFGSTLLLAECERGV